MYFMLNLFQNERKSEKYEARDVTRVKREHNPGTEFEHTCFLIVAGLY